MSVSLNLNSFQFKYSDTLMRFQNSVSTGLDNVSFFMNSGVKSNNHDSNTSSATASYEMASTTAGEGAKSTSNLLESISNQFHESESFLDTATRFTLPESSTKNIQIKKQQQKQQDAKELEKPSKSIAFDDQYEKNNFDSMKNNSLMDNFQKLMKVADQGPMGHAGGFKTVYKTVRTGGEGHKGGGNFDVNEREQRRNEAINERHQNREERRAAREENREHRNASRHNGNGQQRTHGHQGEHGNHGNHEANGHQGRHGHHGANGNQDRHEQRAERHVEKKTVKTHGKGKDGKSHTKTETKTVVKQKPVKKPQVKHETPKHIEPKQTRPNDNIFNRIDDDLIKKLPPKSTNPIPKPEIPKQEKPPVDGKENPNLPKDPKDPDKLNPNDKPERPEAPQKPENNQPQKSTGSKDSGSSSGTKQVASKVKTGGSNGGGTSYETRVVSGGGDNGGISADKAAKLQRMEEKRNQMLQAMQDAQGDSRSFLNLLNDFYSDAVVRFENLKVSAGNKAETSRSKENQEHFDKNVLKDPTRKADKKYNQDSPLRNSDEFITTSFVA